MKRIGLYLISFSFGVALLCLGFILAPDFLKAHLTPDGVIRPQYMSLIGFYRKAAFVCGGAAIALTLLARVFERSLSGFVSRSTEFGEDESSKSAALDLFLISFAGLFFEIMMLRWVPCEFRVLAFLKNIVLMSCLFGFGLGFSLAGRKRDYFSFFPILLSVFVIVIISGSYKLFLLINYPDLESHYVWELESVLPKALNTLAFYFSITAVFVFNMFLFVGAGQLTGRLMKRLPPLRAYSINVAGSLLGVGFFSLMSYLRTGPAVWFTAGVVLSLWFLRKRPAWMAVNAAAAALALVFLMQESRIDIVWTPYYKLQTQPIVAREPDGGSRRIGYWHTVNGASYIETIDLRGKTYPPYMMVYDSRYNLAYKIKPHPRDVLIVGAGTGNNAAAALRHGASHVDAVDIDPEIIEIGKRLHPERPYHDRRVSIHINDARNYFKKTHKKYDLIVFGLLDSQTMFSSMSSIRLDNFVYTEESFREVSKLLKKDGVIYMQFAVGRPWIGNRICGMLQKTFGREPLSTHFGAFVAGPGLDYGYWSRQPDFRQKLYASGRTRLATDDWPYLYLNKPGVSVFYFKALLLILAVSVTILFSLAPETKKPMWHFFFLGAAFLLIEFKSMTEAALLFGSTWIVGSAVISGVLLMVLLANWYCARRETVSERNAYILLFASIAINYFVPVKSMLGGSGYLVQSIVAGSFLALPLFFAGIIFAGSIKKTGRIELAFSSNLLGSIVGGMLEYSSLAFGIRQLYIIAAMLYLLSLILKKSR